MATNINHVAILAGGISHERDVSLRSGRRLADNLKQHGLQVSLIDPDANFFENLSTGAFDVVWPALHGATGEDGTLSDLLELADVAYVGSPSTAARLAWDKPTAKTLVSREGIHTPAGVTITKETFRDYGAAQILRLIESKLDSHLVVKPVQGGSAQGVTITENHDDLAQGMISAYTYHDSALIEERIFGREIAIGIIDTGDGPVALPPVEIEPLSGIYSFEERYNAGETIFHTPARLDADIAKRAAATAVQAHQILGLRDLSRIDLIVDEKGIPWFLEANVYPGLTETSLLPLALEAAGHNLGLVYVALAQTALNRKNNNA